MDWPPVSGRHLPTAILVPARQLQQQHGDWRILQSELRCRRRPGADGQFDLCADLADRQEGLSREKSSRGDHLVEGQSREGDGRHGRCGHRFTYLWSLFPAGDRNELPLRAVPWGWTGLCRCRGRAYRSDVRGVLCARSLVMGGNVRALAVMDGKPWPGLPEIPTVTRRGPTDCTSRSGRASGCRRARPRM